MWLQAGILGVDASLLLKIHEQEHNRRRACGLTEISDRDSLRLLSDLPHGEPVRIADLNDRERTCLQHLPEGTVIIEGGLLTRLALPPVRIQLAVVSDKDPDRGLDRASKFAPFSPRFLVLTRVPDDLAGVEVEARFYGIGLAVVERDALHMVTEPQVVRHRIGPVTWRICEEAYASYLAYSDSPA
jgi:hypothetical protein